MTREESKIERWVRQRTKSPVIEEVRKSYCERCGFRASIRAQIQVDHINGLRYDNRRENLWSVCLNCHVFLTARRRRRGPETQKG